jgi:hypothetical protein
MNSHRQFNYIHEDSHSSQTLEQQQQSNHYDFMSKKLEQERFKVSQKINEQFIIDHRQQGMHRKSLEDNEDSNEDLSDIASIPSITLTNEHEYFQWVKAQSSNTSNSTKQFSSDSCGINRTQGSETDMLDRTPENIGADDNAGLRSNVMDGYGNDSRKL